MRISVTIPACTQCSWGTHVCGIIDSGGGQRFRIDGCWVAHQLPTSPYELSRRCGANCSGGERPRAGVQVRAAAGCAGHGAAGVLEEGGEPGDVLLCHAARRFPTSHAAGMCACEALYEVMSSFAQLLCRPQDTMRCPLVGKRYPQYRVTSIGSSLPFMCSATLGPAIADEATIEASACIHIP